MPDNNLKRFFISIVLPSILAIGFFIVLIFIVILPSFERNSMDGKKETISELTNTAWSLLEEYHQEEADGRIPVDSAKMLAIRRIEQIRYGDEYKDYFWIIDKQPVMIMHPYRSELMQSDLSDYKDPNGKLLFVEAVKTVQESGEGFINYMWQWKDDSTRIVPKLSYVKEFGPWGWIVGTGIYLEDVREEIGALKKRLLWITLIFTLLISAILAFIIRQSLAIETRRRNAEKKLRLSRQKYKSLVDASTEGTLMLLKEEIIFSNVKFSNLAGYDPAEIRRLQFGDLFALQWKNLLRMFTDPRQSVSVETLLNCKNGSTKEVVLSASMISYSEASGYILIVKEVSMQRQLEKEGEALSRELQTSLLLMNQPIRSLVTEVLKCPASSSVRQAADLMTRRRRNILLITQDDSIIGVVNSNDLKRRVVAKGLDSGRPVVEIMTSPVETISESALLYEALLQLKSRNISHLATRNRQGIISGVIGYEDIMEMQQNSISFLIREIEIAEDVNQLATIYKRVPVLVKALIDSGDKTENINRIITSVADAMHRRVIGFGVEELGTPPCGFAFMVMGSEGRGEQTLVTDQDNAIVYENIEGGIGVVGNGEGEVAGQGKYEGAGESAGVAVGMVDGGNSGESTGENSGGNSGEDIREEAVEGIGDEVRSYFLQLGERVNRDLHTIGYHYCKGEIMAKNPKWTQPLECWKRYFSGWINTSNPQDILDVAIFFDFRYIYGDEQLVIQLREHVNRVSENKSVFFYHMAQSVMKFKPPLNIFGKIVGRESGVDSVQLDIKKAIMPVLAFIRLYAIREKLRCTNSMERLHALTELKTIDSASHEELVQAFDLMMHLRLKFQVESISRNELPGNIIDLNRLTRMEAAMLKKIFSQIADLQTRVGFEFKG
jgi:signal-transduction protein with cAMP-binding, CBS, and nucleotidyltransferase domain